jgi:hypothetical protein
MTWALFHPVFIILLYVALIFLNRKFFRSRCGTLVFVVALLVAFLPSVKNQIMFGIFSNGSWVGLNLAQVAPDLSAEAREECDFGNYLEKKKSKQTSHAGTLLNYPDIVPLSKKCVRLSVINITYNPKKYLLRRYHEFAHSMSLLPHNYHFTPHNWPFWNEKDENKDKYIKADVYQALVRSYYGLVIFIAIATLILRWNSPNARILTVLLLMATWFLFFAYAFNGHEQQRMRWTIEFIFPLLLAISLNMHSSHRMRGRQ